MHDKIYLGDTNKVEEELIEGRTTKPTVWLRYLDDFFFISEHGEKELLEWLSYRHKRHKKKSLFGNKLFR